MKAERQQDIKQKITKIDKSFDFMSINRNIFLVSVISQNFFTLKIRLAML